MTQETCLLVALKLSAWSGSKVDKDKSTEVTTSAHADNGAATVWKKLVGKEWLEGIQRIDSLIRADFYRFTLAYPATSIRVLPESAMARFDNRMLELFDQRTDSIAEALGSYVAEREDARARLGDMFSESDYPAMERVAEKYSAAITHLPMPAGWKAGINDETIRANLDQARREGFAEAHKDAWQRVAECTRAVADKLKAYQPDAEARKDQKIFRDSLIDNAKQLVETLESMVGVLDDPDLTAALETIKAEIAAHSPEALRSDEAARYRVMNTAAAVLDQALAKIAGGYQGEKAPPAQQPAQPEPAPWKATPIGKTAIRVEPVVSRGVVPDDYADLMD